MTDEKKPGKDKETTTPATDKAAGKPRESGQTRGGGKAEAASTPGQAPGKAGAAKTGQKKPSGSPAQQKEPPGASPAGPSGNEKTQEPPPAASELDLIMQGGGDRAAGPPPPKSSRGKGRGNGAGILALLLVLVLAVAVVGGGWWLWERQQALENVQAGLASNLELAELRATAMSQADRLTGRVDNLAAEHQAHVQQLARVEAAMDSVRDSQTRIASRMERLEDLAAAHRQDWILSEADYLFGVATHRLRFRRDVDGAFAALQDADRLLARLGADTAGQRQQIRQAIDALLEVRQPDRTALAADLNALIEGVDAWDIAQPETRIRPEPMAGQPDADLTSVEGWQQASSRAWRQFKSSLSSLVVVRRNDPVPPLVSPEESWFLRENVRLQMQTARLALLGRESEVYQNSLEQADAWLARYFSEDDPAVRQARQTLERLGAVELTPELPDLAELLPRIDRQQEDDA